MTTPRPADPPARGRAAAVLLAAGRSTRMGLAGGQRKPFLELLGRTVIERTLDVFAACPSVAAIVLVGASEDLARLRALAEGGAAGARLAAVVAGGRERTDSVRAGVRAAPEDCELVAIHDAARPLVAAAAVEATVAAAAEEGAALLAVPCTDTVKSTRDGAHSDATLDRSKLWLAQTPQVFGRARFLELLERARAEGFTPTDDAALYERYVGPVRLVPGARENLKLTTREDLVLARAILREREARAGRGEAGA